MTMHRFLYKICWRTRLLWPLLVCICLIAMALLLLGSGGHFEYTAEGRLRIQYANGRIKDAERGGSWRDDMHALAPPGEQIYVQEHDDPFFRPELVTQQQRYLNANLQNAWLFKANLTKEFETDPLIKKPLIDKVFYLGTNSSLKNVTHAKRRMKVGPGRSKDLYYDKNNPPDIFLMWRESTTNMCNGNFTGIANEFALLKNVMIMKSKCHSQRKGGEFLEDVVNQPEEIEYIKFEMGCFQMSCHERPDYHFNGDSNHLNDYLLGLKTKYADLGRPHMVNRHFTIAITRYEYANIYHTMTDWYNAFLVMQYFNKTQEETNILVIDTHPRGVLDPVWPVLFNSATRLSYLPPKAMYTNLVWGMLGYNSAMLQHYNPDLSLVEEFRSFFLNSYRIADRHKLNCKSLKVLFVWRRDYVAHPRNPSGRVSRKVHNEAEIIRTIQEKYRDFRVVGIQIDLFSMQQQLKFISSADICIGMHGAGLTHAMFLPKHSALIELLPNYWSVANDHFSAIANWRHLFYQRWVNEDLDNESENFFTRIPPSVIEMLVGNAVSALCEPNKQWKREDALNVQFPDSLPRMDAGFTGNRQRGNFDPLINKYGMKVSADQKAGEGVRTFDKRPPHLREAPEVEMLDNNVVFKPAVQQDIQPVGQVVNHNAVFRPAAPQEVQLVRQSLGESQDMKPLKEAPKDTVASAKGTKSIIQSRQHNTDRNNIHNALNILSNLSKGKDASPVLGQEQKYMIETNQLVFKNPNPVLEQAREDEETKIKESVKFNQINANFNQIIQSPQGNQPRKLIKEGPKGVIAQGS